LALALRFTGLDRELPHRIEPDGFIAYHLQLLRGDPALVHGVRFADRYPSLLAKVFSLLPYPEVPARASGPGDERVHLDAAARPFRLVRSLVALASTLGVALTWLLARRFLAPAAALLAAFLAATSLLSILFSGQARPHGIEASLALAAVLLALRARERPSVARILLAAATAAAAAGALQNGLFALLPLGAGILLAGPQSTGGLRRTPIVAFAWAGLACAAAGVLALTFYPGLPHLGALGLQLGSAESGAHTIRPSLTNLSGLSSLARILWEHDPLLAVLAPAGAILGLVSLRPLLRRTNRTAGRVELDLAIVLAYLLPYLAVLALDPNVRDRFLLPLIPYLACLSAGALSWIIARIRGRARETRIRMALASFVGILLAGAPLLVAIRFARAAVSPDTLELAATWIRDHVGPEQRILTTPGTVLPLLIDAECLRADLEDPTVLSFPWLAYQSLLPPSRDGDRRWKIRLIPVARRFDPHGFDRARAEAWIRDERADFVLIEDSLRMRRHFSGVDLEQAANAMGDLEYSLDGQIPAPTDIGPIDYQNARGLARRLLGADAFGPGILIYRIRR
jgi:hypothetical protein